MIRASTVILVIVCVSTTLEQSIPNSPCPNVFQYEQTGFEPGQWYGVVNLSTDNTLHSLWLNIVLDGKANILGNWVGDVTTNDNIDFKIENTNMKIHPGPAVAVRFFVRYDKLNKPPRVQAIRLNGREICKANANPTIDRPDLVSRPDSRPMSESRPDVASRPVERPVSTRPNEARPETRPDTKPIIRAEDSPITRPVYGRPSGDGPVYTPTQNPPIDQSNVNPYSIGGSAPSQSVTEGRPYQLTTSTFRTTTRDDDDDSRPDPSEYFEGGQPTFIVSGSGSGNSGSGNSGSGNSGGGSNDNSNNRRTRDQCGKVVRNSPNPLVVNGKPTLEGQWPWQIALYQTQTVDNKYICGGTLVSHRHVITAAHCVTRKESARVVNKNTLTVYLGKHNLRTTVDGVQIRLVSDIIVNPRYNASSFSRDLGILRLRESVQYTDYVRPACLWPDDLVDLNNVIGKTGSVVGWGFDETGVATEELTLVEMPVVDHLTCIRSYSEFFSRFTSDDTYCAGFRDGTSVCNGDSGGGMVFRMQGLWYLRGLVSLSVAKHNEYRCDTSHYVIFTDLAKFLPWLKDNIRD